MKAMQDVCEAAENDARFVLLLMNWLPAEEAVEVLHDVSSFGVDDLEVAIDFIATDSTPLTRSQALFELSAQPASRNLALCLQICVRNTKFHFEVAVSRGVQSRTSSRLSTNWAASTWCPRCSFSPWQSLAIG